jgi:uncharacterized Fe-S center protein
MNKTLFIILLILYLVILAFLIYTYINCPNRKGQCLITKLHAGAAKVEAKQATVYFTDDISPEGLQKVLTPYLERLTGKVAVKVHFGDDGNQYYIKPELFKDIVTQLKGTFIETNVLYRGRRRVTETHIQLAKEHGFTYAPIDIIDSEGELEIPCDARHFKTAFTGSHLTNYDSFLIISHFKGHGNAGFGGAIKNVGMGMAAIPGKMAIHADSHPRTTPKRCIKCGKCTTVCPTDAITLNPLVIDLTKCIACGKCIGTCPSGALAVPWGATGENGFLERLTDYAQAITAGRNCIYVNVLKDISPDCDCMGHARKPFVKDIGILVSDDMVAVDTASSDLVDQAYGKPDAFLHEDAVSGRYALDYGQQIGLGTKNYTLITK